VWRDILIRITVPEAKNLKLYRNVHEIWNMLTNRLISYPNLLKGSDYLVLSRRYRGKNLRVYSVSSSLNIPGPISCLAICSTSS
jgi:hypothetical protein